MDIDYLLQHCRDIQFMLRRVGYSCMVNGAADERTRRCIRAFQRDLQIPYHGRMDAITLQKLQRCFRNMSRNVKDDLSRLIG